MKIKNKDLIAFAIVAIILILLYVVMKKYPANSGDRQPPLHVNQYTSGAIANGMDVNSRTNFQQQPVGGNFS